MSSSRLSDAAIVGITVSIAIVLIAAILSFVYLYRLRLRKTQGTYVKSDHQVGKEGSNSTGELIPGGRLEEDI